MSPAKTSPPVPRLQIETVAAWRAWLKANHARATGVWLVTWKKASGHPILFYPDLVREALRYGWVDSRPNALDAARSMRLFSPRKPGSAWSRINKKIVTELIAAGKMTAAGLAKVEAAKRDGSWKAYDGVEKLAVPADLARALRVNPKAAANFAGFPPSSQKIILWWIASAKRAATREQRVDETVRLAAINVRANHWRQPKGACP